MGFEPFTPRARFTPWFTPARAALSTRLQTRLKTAFNVSLVAVALGLGAGLSDAGAFSAWARTHTAASTLDHAVAASTVGLSQLPQQAQDVHRRVLVGGPFRYDKDGTVFGNRERILPRRTRGFYREYTVPTPGVRHRGARRIVCGGAVKQAPETCFYTEDHYSSFKTIDPRR